MNKRIFLASTLSIASLSAVANAELPPVKILSINYSASRTGPAVSFKLRVKNTGYDKKVGLVFSMEDRMSTKVRGSHCNVEADETDGYEIWSCTNRSFTSFRYTKVAAYYYDASNNQTYWDNNNGDDYKLNGPF